jgi:hypothetical protein
MTKRSLPKEFEAKKVKRERKPAEPEEAPRDWRDQVRLHDEAPSGTFRIPRI